MSARRLGLLWIFFGIFLTLTQSGSASADPVGPFVADFTDTQDPGKFALQAFPMVNVSIPVLVKNNPVTIIPKLFFNYNF